MTVRPIIFSAPMVKALLADRKTMTRRIVSPANCEFGSIAAGKLSKLYWEHADWSKAWSDRGFPDPRADGAHTSGYLHVPCHDTDEEDGCGIHCDVCAEWGWAGSAHRLYPRVKPGDCLWVKETFTLESDYEIGPYPPPFSDGRPVKHHDDVEDGKWWQQPHYRATDPVPDLHYKGEDDPRCKWMPSIFMPRWASRITLKVTAVKVERLQEISEEDAKAEGCEPTTCANVLAPKDGFPSYRSAFAMLWESIHGPGSWSADDWVVAFTFEVIKKNVADVLTENAQAEAT